MIFNYKIGGMFKPLVYLVNELRARSSNPFLYVVNSGVTYS